jgi:hypothetical protein
VSNGGPIPSGLDWLDRAIYLSIRGRSRERSVSLVDLIGGVDSQQKLIVTHGELVSGLGRLIDRGVIGEATHVSYFDSSADAVPSARFSGISESEFEAAISDYHAMMDPLIQEFLDKHGSDTHGDDFSLPLTVVWAIPNGAYPTDADADAAIPLMEAIDRAIGPTGLASPAGFQFGPGEMTMYLWAGHEGVGADDVYAIVAPIVRAYPMPVGSHIIRRPDTDRETVSDIVTD